MNLENYKMISLPINNKVSKKHFKIGNCQTTHLKIISKLQI